MLLPPNLFLLIHMVWNPCHLNLIMVSLLLLKCQGPSYRRPDGKINISLLFRPSIIRGPWINTKIMLIRWFAALSRYYFSLLVWIFYLYYINHSIIHTKTNFYTSLFSSFITQLPLKFPVKLKELELLHLPQLLFTKIHQIQQKISPIHQIQIRVVDVVVFSHVVKNVVGITLRTHFGGNWKIAHSTKGKTRR